MKNQIGKEKLVIQNVLDKIIAHEELTKVDIFNVMREIEEEKASSLQIAGFLAGLSTKKPSSKEIAYIASTLKELCIPVRPDVSGILTDSCGTGGGNRTFNISTTDSIVAAAAGVKIAKHGARSISSKSGSADALESLGVNINLTSSQAEKLIESIGIAFLHAPLFNPIMGKVFYPEKELGIKTIFNTYIGPLINPADVKAHVLGVYKPEFVEIFSSIMQHLNYKHALVVHGMDGLDEISISDVTLVSEIRGKKVEIYEIQPEDYGLKKWPLNKITGNFTPEENANIIRSIFEGKEKDAKRDIVILNSAAVCYCGGVVTSIRDGIELVENILDEGSASKKLHEFITYSNM